jgi:hypothetical protein
MPVLPLLRFLQKLRQNPDPDMVNQLLPFVSKNDYRLTNWGNIVAWKKAHKNDDGTWTDAWTQRLNYTPPVLVHVDPKSVVKDPYASCASGLHFATWNYCYHYYGGNGHVLEIHVDPKDVMSIPIRENEKGRCCSHYLYREIPNWKELGPDNPPDARSYSTPNEHYKGGTI